MDLIQSYHDDDDEEDQVVEGNAKADAPAAEAQRTTPREASSSSSEYYSTSSSEYYSTSSEGEGDDGAGGAAKDGGGGAASASDTESSASGVDGEEETARAASMIDNLLQSKGWEALNGDDSDEEADAGTSGPRTKNEVEPEVPAPLPADLVRDDDTLVEVGKISCVVENTVVVQYGGNCSVYDIGSVLCSGRRGAGEGSDGLPSKLRAGDNLGGLLGRVDEVFGPVKQPLYSLRCHDDAIREHCEVGKPVYAVERLSKVVVESKLYTKGYDNSGKFDEEVAPGEDAFSDDEKEMEVKRSRRQRKRKVGSRGTKPGGQTARGGGQNQHQNFYPPRPPVPGLQSMPYPSYYQPPAYPPHYQPHHHVGPAFAGQPHQHQGGGGPWGQQAPPPGGYDLYNTNSNNSNNNNRGGNGNTHGGGGP